MKKKKIVILAVILTVILTSLVLICSIFIKNKQNTKNTNNSNLTSNTEETNIPSKLELQTFDSMQYYLYIPSNPVDNMPLIMYLHGGTNKNSNVESLLTLDGFPKYLSDGYYENLKSYVVIPKLTNSYTGWADVYSTLGNLITEINKTYKINLNKVSLTGHSMGGTGTYQVQMKMPNTFACIAPMSGSVKNTADNVAALSKTKIWAFIGTEDTVVDPSSTRTIIEELKNNGADAKITEFVGATHFDVPALGYKNDELINWLIS